MLALKKSQTGNYWPVNTHRCTKRTAPCSEVILHGVLGKYRPGAPVRVNPECGQGVISPAPWVRVARRLATPSLHLAKIRNLPKKIKKSNVFGDHGQGNTGGHELPRNQPIMHKN